MIVLEELSRSSSDANRSSRAHGREHLFPVALHTLPFRRDGLPPHVKTHSDVKNEHQNKQTVNC
jgi:hypothetical protein